MAQLSFYIVLVSEATIYTLIVPDLALKPTCLHLVSSGLQLETIDMHSLLSSPATVLGSHGSCQW